MVLEEAEIGAKGGHTSLLALGLNFDKNNETPSKRRRKRLLKEGHNPNKRDPK
jgi:hypothetical protein